MHSTASGTGKKRLAFRVCTLQTRRFLSKRAEEEESRRRRGQSRRE
jgi:hypothetical protein